MRKLLTSLVILAPLVGCANLGYNEGQFATRAEQEAYIIGSSHAGLESCKDYVDSVTLSLHHDAALRAALAQPGGREDKLREAFEAGLRQGGGRDSPHKLDCDHAQFVLNCSLSDYMTQWRDAAVPVAK